MYAVRIIPTGNDPLIIVIGDYKDCKKEVSRICDAIKTGGIVTVESIPYIDEDGLTPTSIIVNTKTIVAVDIINIRKLFHSSAEPGIESTGQAYVWDPYANPIPDIDQDEGSYSTDLND